MELFAKIIALLRCLYPLPAFTDAGNILKWLNALSPAGSELIAFIVNQLQTKGFAEVSLPNGEAVIIRRTSATEYSSHIVASAVAYEGDVEADGKWIALFKKMLPYIIQFLPLLISEDTNVNVPIK